MPDRVRGRIATSKFYGSRDNAAAHVISVNETYARTVIERHGLPADRVTVVRNGPDLHRFDPGMAPVEGLAPPDQAVVMYVGSIGVQDGVDSLVRSIGHLVHDLGRDDVVCLVLGGGVAVGELEALARTRGVAENVRFLGPVPRDAVPGYLARADVCVAPERSNAYNDRSTMIKVLEYMAMAKPIVAFDLPEHRYSAREAAVYVADDDELVFARELARLLDDPRRRRTLGRAGRRRIEEELAWEHQAPKLLGVYRALATSSARLAAAPRPTGVAMRCRIPSVGRAQPSGR